MLQMYQQTYYMWQNAIFLPNIWYLNKPGRIQIFWWHQIFARAFVTSPDQKIVSLAQQLSIADEAFRNQ